MHIGKVEKLPIIKKNRSDFIKTLFYIEVGAVLIYFFAGLVGHYAQIYRNFPISKYISFQMAQALFIFIGQSCLLALVYFKLSSEYKQPPNIKELVSTEENENLEFKSSFRWDKKLDKVNKSLEKAAMKTIAAFLNSQGGHLVIGVDDFKNIVGLEKDISSLAKQNRDGFDNHFTNIFHNMIGPTFRHHVNLTHVDVEGKTCCIVSVAPAYSPVYLKSDDNNEEFYIRTGNGTTPLKLSEATKYIKSRF